MQAITRAVKIGQTKIIKIVNLYIASSINNKYLDKYIGMRYIFAFLRKLILSIHLSYAHQTLTKHLPNTHQTH